MSNVQFKTIELPLEEAVQLSAKENFDRDVRMDLEEGSWDDADTDIKEIYLEEARHLLVTEGESYQPDFPDHHLIKVKK